MDSGDSGDSGAPASDGDCGVVTGTGCGSVRSPVDQLGTCVDSGVPDPDTGPSEGSVEGGSCQCGATGGAPLFAVVVALVVLLRRIAPILLVLLPLPVFAQDLDSVDGQAVQILDGGAFPALWDGEVGPAWSARGGLGLNYAHQPVVYVVDGTVQPVVQSVVTRHWTASLNLGGFVRLGLELPVHRPAVVGPLVGSWRGDLALWATVPLSEGKPVDSSLVVHTDVPTGAPEVWLGDPGGHITGLYVASFPAGPVRGLVNAGIRTQRAQDLPGLVWGTRLRYGLGIEAQPGLGSSITLEGFGSTPTRARHDGPGAWPFEFLVGTSKQVGRNIRVGGAAGAGLGLGLGNPVFRMLGRVEAGGNEAEDTDGDGILDARDRCRRVPEDVDGYRDQDGCPDLDNDQDGIPDASDDCPMEPEVRNGWQDEDGCPDAVGRLQLTVRLEQPDAAEVVMLGVGPKSPVGVLHGETWTGLVPSETVDVRLEASGHHPHVESLRFPEGGEVARDITLLAVRFGEVELRVTDLDGAPLDAWVQRAEGEVVSVPGGALQLEVVAGTQRWQVLAEGHHGQMLSFDVPAQGRVPLTVALEPAEVFLDGDRLVVDERVRFGLDDDGLDEEARLALDAVAAFLLAHPELELVRVEGHADGTGSSRYNYDLSRRRAQTVVDHLVGRGVAAERLDPIGTGEAAVATDEAESRRVGFTVLVWNDDVLERPEVP